LASRFPNSFGRELRTLSGEVGTASRKENASETLQLEGGDSGFRHAFEQNPSTTFGPGFAAMHKLNLDCL
jgi:hypothetical protein